MVSLAASWPDDAGVWAISPPVWPWPISAWRSWISPGHQPMASATGRYRIAFNGEIYNHHSLRQHLQRAGRPAQPWRGHSDTETLLASTVGSGRRLATLFRYVRLALWDRQERRLHLAVIALAKSLLLGLVGPGGSACARVCVGVGGVAGLSGCRGTQGQSRGVSHFFSCWLPASPPLDLRRSAAVAARPRRGVQQPAPAPRSPALVGFGAAGSAGVCTAASWGRATRGCCSRSARADPPAGLLSRLWRMCPRHFPLRWGGFVLDHSSVAVRQQPACAQFHHRFSRRRRWRSGLQ